MIGRFRRTEVEHLDREDAEIVRRTLAGDLRAFDALVHRHHADLLRALRTITRNLEDAEDAAQDAFVRAFQALDRFDQERPFRPWLWTIGIRLALHRIARKETKNVSLEDARPGAEGIARDDRAHMADATGVQHLDETLLRRDLDRAMDRLDAHHRAVLQLCVIEQKTYEEAAEILEVPKGTIMSRLSRARLRLREFLCDVPAPIEAAGGDDDRAM